MLATPDEGAPELLSMLLPLHYFYAGEDRHLPKVELLEGAALPEPEQSLLFHEGDMTSTLSRFHGAEMDLDVLAQECSEDYLIRMVVLRNRDTGAPVEFGAIGIRLEKFEGPVRGEIERGSAPLGALLEKYLIDFRSAPRAYFRMAADGQVAKALGEAEGVALYGRCNELTDPEGYAFADIVEVLPANKRFVQSTGDGA
jgi:chorismate-pyruvate lyase